MLVPFGTWLREASDAAYHEQAGGRGRAVLDLKPDANALAAAERERLAEDLRLLYVAMTRARRALYLGVANLSPGGRISRLRATALGHLLLGPGDAASDDELAARLDALAAASESIRVEALDAPAVGQPAHLAVTPRRRAHAHGARAAIGLAPDELFSPCRGNGPFECARARCG